MIPATIFTILTILVMLFQLALALRAPWGSASMGGKYPGKYPVKMRIVALVNMLVLGFTAAIILAKADIAYLMLKPIIGVGIWIVVGFFALGTIMNTITRSKIERIWAPVALGQCITSLLIALG